MKTIIGFVSEGGNNMSPFGISYDFGGMVIIGITACIAAVCMYFLARNNAADGQEVR